MPERDMSVLVVGGGGREHALAWSLARSSRVGTVYVAPGNGGTADEAKVENVALKDDDLEGLRSFAGERAVDLTVVGPEVPLALGIVDRFRADGRAIFGPTRAAARLESSKAWARAFLARHGIPHPAFTLAEDVATAERAVRELGGRCVVKADGLAAGKGVIVCREMSEALSAVRLLMIERRFGAAGERILVEELVEGPELSVMAACHGTSYALFPPAQDYKRLNDGDGGPNTGGMGSYSPPPIASQAVMAAASARFVEPTLAGMEAEGCPFTGCLYCGLMLTEGGPVVIEFNVRFGDPETQAQLPLCGDDLLGLLSASAAGDLGGVRRSWASDRVSVCVVLASAGYPERTETGQAVHGLATAVGEPDVKVFHAGTLKRDGTVVTSGGRVLGIVCSRPTFAEAVAGAYGAVGPAGVHFKGMHYRRDIAARAVGAGGGT